MCSRDEAAPLEWRAPSIHLPPQAGEGMIGAGLAQRGSCGMRGSRRWAGLCACAALAGLLIGIAPPAFATPDAPAPQLAQAASPQLEALVKRLNDLGIKNGTQPFTVENA